MALSWPVKGPVTQFFGSNPSSIQPNGHTGVDFGIPVGTPIYAADSGNIEFEGWASTLSASNPYWIAPAYAGIIVLINHNDGLMSLTGHMSSTVVNNGQFVEKGQLIGYSGNTGLSTGPHLHYEILGWPLQPYNGFYGRLNPSAYVSGYAEDTIKPAGNITPIPTGNQRLAGGNNVNQRSEPNTSAPIVRIIAANTLEVFDGFVYGEDFAGSNIWFKDTHGYAWAGAFTYSGTDGLTNLTPPPALAPHERKVNEGNVNQRLQPNTASAVVRVIAANSKEAFSGYVRGENVTVGGFTSDIWYKDAQGYAWAGGFTPSDTSGLADLTPTPVPPTPVLTATRTTVPQGVRVRNLPSLSGVVKATLPASTEMTVKGYVVGDSVADSNIWYVLDTGYSHTSGWTSASTDGLTKLEVAVNPVVVDTEAYSFTPDFDFVEYRPAHTNNMQNGNFPENPEMLVLHQFDAKDNYPSLDGVITHFQTSRSNPSSAHFGVSGKRIVQFVSLKDRAFHAGSVGNNYIGIEIDPQEDADTVASVKKLIAALNQRYGKVFAYTKHRDVPGNATACGVDIHLEKYVIESTPVPPVVVVPPVDDEPEVIIPPVVNPDDPQRTEEEIIREFLAFCEDHLVELWLNSRQ